MNQNLRDILPPPVSQPPQNSLWSRLGLLPFLLALPVIISVGGLFVSGPLLQEKTILVPHGAGPHEVATLLDNEGTIYSSFLFRVAAKLMAGNALKAGEYSIQPGQSMANILSMIHEGRSVQRLFTVAEGLTSNEVARLLAAVPALGGDNVPVPAEGSLLPESYRYIYGDSRAGLVTRMQKAMQDTLAELWEKRDVNIPITSPEQAVVLASIVEKETGKPAERPRIAGVFYNRLRHNMRLQSDPTVIYGIMAAHGFMDHDIEHADLAFPSPYNTYMNDGLPPKPICNPGRAALEAVLRPEWNDYLFFVADGTGGHVFAHNLAEHNQNVMKWNELQSKK